MFPYICELPRQSHMGLQKARMPLSKAVTTQEKGVRDDGTVTVWKTGSQLLTATLFSHRTGLCERERMYSALV